MDPETRRRHDRKGLRYSHDLTDEEWVLIASLISPAKPGGNKRTVDVREIVNGLMYILGTGCQWRDIPKDLPPRSTIHDYLDRWGYDGTLQRIHHRLFCFPTYYYAEALVVPKGNPKNLHSLNDLKGHTVGTLLGTNYAEWIQAIPGINFQGYKDWAQIIPELAIGRTEAALYDQPVVAAQMKEHPEWKIEIVPDYEPRTLKNPSGYSSYAFRQGDIQWVTAFSSAIEWMEYNGEMKTILPKWGLTGYNN